LTGTADEITADVVRWIGAALPDVAVNVHSLGDRKRQPGVDLRILRVAPRPGSRTADAPLIAELDYLATVQLDDAAAEQRVVGELLFAAMDRRDVEVVAALDLVQLCASLGIAAAPGFILRTPLVRSRPAEAKPRVRAPLVVHTSELGIITGRVLGPQDTPVAGATVSAVGLDRFVRTDRHGQFKITAAPGDSDVRLIARARGAQIEGVATVGQPVTLRLPLEV